MANLENRRQFFRKCATKILPVITLLAVPNLMLPVKSESPLTGCNGSCMGSCKGSCKGSCTGNAENHAKVIVAGFAVTHVMAPVVEIAECRAVVLVSGHVRTTAQERVELHVP